MMELFLFILYLIIWFGLTQKRKSVEGYFSLFFVFGLAGFAYFNLIPFEMYMKGEDFFWMINWIQLESNEKTIIFILSILSLLGFYFGLILSKYRLFSVNNNVLSTNSRFNENYFFWAIISLLIVFFACFFTLIIFYRDTFAAQSDYATAYRITYESPVFGLIKMHLLISLALIGGIIVQKGYGWKGNLVFFISIISILCIGLLTSDKDPLLIALLASGVLFQFDKISLKKFATLTIVGCTAIIILVLFFNLFRAKVPLNEIISPDLFSSISFTTLDPAGPMHSLAQTISDDLINYKYGSTYVISLGVLVPKILWPDRPLDLSEEYARGFIGDWSEGQGLAYSPLAEAYTNFGIPGAFIHYLFFGFLTGSFLVFLKNKIFFRNNMLFIPFVYTVVYYAVILSFRSPLIGPIKIILMLVAPYFIIAIILKILGAMLHVINKSHDRIILKT